MRPPSSIWSPFEGVWETALTDADWMLRFRGPLPPTCTAWLRPGPAARFVPCPHADGCGQPHRVQRLSDRDTWIATPETLNCESVPLAPAHYQTRQLHLDALLVSLAQALRLDAVAVERVGVLPACFRLGHAGRTHLPVYFSPATDPAATSRAASALTLLDAGPFVLFVPLAQNLPACLRATLRERGGACAALDEALDLDAQGRLVALKPLGAFLPALARPRAAAAPLARLLVPPGTRWEEVRLKVINGKTLVATCGSQTTEASAEQLGQVPRDDPEAFRPSWKTLVAFAARQVLTGEEDHLFPNASDFKNRRAELRALLRSLVSIETDPFLDLSKTPPAPDDRADRPARALRRGYALRSPIQLIQGADKRRGHLSDLGASAPEEADT